LRLTIDVTYEENGETIADLKTALRKAADIIAGEGLLSGNLDAVVDDRSAKVETIP
jgi:hypothetical protein